ncbi:tyrosine-type recombinase/integrase [Methylobacterium sp. WL103]|uniref:tyrosine-type recombinase/integrase n=1 Tax=Methylobacterium sp. WL103 TaxID=2603891 RepID=UPI0011C76DC3|nr:tyrosine-type recombinase/integrase [Methylobacterium sp. WL103]TXN07382.1 tyrosine-type recombinase/integrase [Methylobacterium sp. WL103]
MAGQRITKRFVDGLEPRASEYAVWDRDLSGFGVRVRPTGAKSYITVYRAGRGRSALYRRQTIGATDKLSADQARQEAERILAGATLGADPAAELAAAKVAQAEDRKAPKVRDLLDRFLTEHVATRLKARTAAGYRQIIEQVLKPEIGDLPVRSLTPARVAELHHGRRATRTHADASVRVLSSAMSLAETWGLREPGSNPCRVRKFGSRRRERLFSDIEVAKLLNAVEALASSGVITEFQALGIRLLFATGCRVGEITALQWDYVDFDEGVIAWPDTKTGALTKPLTDEARSLLTAAPRIAGAAAVCPSKSLKPMRVETMEGAFEKVMATAGVPAKENATTHLVRHWFCTKIYSDPTIPLPNQMRICGHKSVATAMRYAQLQMDAVKREAEASSRKRAVALQEARRKIEALNVIPLRVGG